jgi:hypothetical protein
MAFIVVSFHWTTSLAPAGEKNRATVRQNTKVAIGTGALKPIARRRFTMDAILL